MRSCYRSKWRVWNDSTDTVNGRYYRVPHDARGVPLVPAYPGPSILTSQRWWDKNFNLQQPDLGEVISPYQTWDNGAPPIELPQPIVAGDPDCIENGESIASGLTLEDESRFRSWPAACFVQNPLDDWGWAAGVYRCEVQDWWADRVIELSSGQIGDCVGAHRQRFPGADVRFWEGARFFPPMITIRHPLYLVAQFAETQTGLQALIQVLQGVQSPTDVGGYSSTQIWARQAQRGLIRLSSQGGGFQEPILLVGYSYGGAAAQNAAAICRLGNAERRIRYLTFGAPRAGDERMQNLLHLPTRGCALANSDDAITAIPPDIDTIIPAETVLGRALLPFARWRPVFETWRQTPGGSVQPNVYPSLSTQEIVDLLNLVWTTGTLFGYPAHNIREYKRRILLRCPGVPRFADGMLGIGFNIAFGLGLDQPGTGGGIAKGRVAWKSDRGIVCLGQGAVNVAQRGFVGLQFKGIPGQLGLQFKGIPGQLGLGVVQIAAGQLGPGVFQIAAGQLGLAFKGIPGQLGLGVVQIAAGQLGLGFAGVPGQLGLGFAGVPGQLGLANAAPMGVAAGQLGLGVVPVAAGQLGLGFAGVPGQLGLANAAPMGVAAGQLGLAKGEGTPGPPPYPETYSAAFLEGSIGLGDDQFHCVFALYDGAGNTRIRVDFEWASPWTATGSATILYTSAVPFCLGGGTFAPGNGAMDGQLQDVRVWSSYNPTEAEMNTLAAGDTSTTIPTPADFWLKCTEGTGTVLNDSSGNGNTTVFAAGPNAPTWVGGILTFTGNNQWATSATHAGMPVGGLVPYTLMVRIRTTDLTSSVIMQGGGTLGPWYLGYANP
jgi:hypothetical protein